MTLNAVLLTLEALGAALLVAAVFVWLPLRLIARRKARQQQPQSATPADGYAMAVRDTSEG